MTTVLAASAFAGARIDGGSAAKSVKVGFIYSRTGGLSAVGGGELEGFQLGLKYTQGKCGGYTITPTYVDDATDPTKAIAAAKDLIGQGYKVLAGSTSSGTALGIAPLAAQNNVLFISSGAISDAITGVNRNTFRASRQSTQDVLDAANIFPPKSSGKKVVVFAEDSAAGQSTAAAVQNVFGGRGHSVSKILVPFGAADVTPYVQQLKNTNADAVFVSWGGSNLASMLQALQQQGIAKQMTVIYSLLNRAIYPQVGPLLTGVTLVSPYVYNAPKNPVNDWLVQQMKNRGQKPDVLTPTGFITAQMICHALAKGDPTNTSSLIGALEGWKFTGPEGNMFIRPQDHGLMKPMFQVKLVKDAKGHWDSKPVKTVSPGNVQPPIHPFP